MSLTRELVMLQYSDNELIRLCWLMMVRDGGLGWGVGGGQRLPYVASRELIISRLLVSQDAQEQLHGQGCGQ